jgi:taurine dioxygenase
MSNKLDGLLASDLSATPLSPVVGLRISGIDWRDPVDPMTATKIVDAFNRHSVLCFPDQDLSDEDQRRFAGLFGKADESERRPPQNPHGPVERGLMLITNIRENGKPIGHLPDGEMQFHSDGAHREAPYRATTLFAIKVTSRGGETLFANLNAAYEALPAAMKRRIEGLRTEIGYQYGTTNRDKPPREDPERPPAIHALVKTHPVTGRKSLYLGRLMTRKIVGLDSGESNALLAELFDYAEKPEFVYAHRWAPGHLLIWDNRAVNHARADFPADEIRLLRRCTVDGPDSEA